MCPVERRRANAPKLSCGPAQAGTGPFHHPGHRRDQPDRSTRQLQRNVRWKLPERQNHRTNPRARNRFRAAKLRGTADAPVTPRTLLCPWLPSPARRTSPAAMPQRASPGNHHESAGPRGRAAGARARKRSPAGLARHEAVHRGQLNRRIKPRDESPPRPATPLARAARKPAPATVSRREPAAKLAFGRGGLPD